MQLVERHLPRIRRMLAAVLRGGAEDVADAEQEVLAGLYVELARFRFAASFQTFLFRFCRNKAVDLLRREARQRRAAAAAARAAAVGPVLDPDERLEHEQRRSVVIAALGRLRPGERLLVLLREVEGLGMEEIAKITGLPSGTVKSRLHRTRDRLARLARGMVP